MNDIDPLIYRIPTIDEFTFGFEYEIYSEGTDEDCVEDFCGWYAYQFQISDWRSIDEIEFELTRQNIRVKNV